MAFVKAFSTFVFYKRRLDVGRRVWELETTLRGYNVASGLPRYAILSHTWGDGEVLFEDMMAMDRTAAKKKSGYSKIENGCRRAAADGFEYLWMDTCCVDKNSLVELSESINSMFRWYKQCSICYVFLEDCHGPKPYQVSSHSANVPRWFTRGWTLQELIAPNTLHFYSAKWAHLGTKADHMDGLSLVTGIDHYALGGGDLSKISIARRMSWMANRKTTRTEDMAYCLLGIFGITMPLLYGEGPKAFARLQEAIMKETDDQSLFAWKEDGAGYRDSGERGGLLAFSPLCFASSTSVSKFYSPRPGGRQNAITNQASVVNLLLCQDMTSRSNDDFFAILDCSVGHTPGVLAGIRLKRKHTSGNDFMRIDASQVFQFARVERDGSVAIEGFDPTKEQEELMEVRSRVVYRNWFPQTIRVLQASVEELPPGFWLVSPQNVSSPTAITIQMAYPVKFWDSQTWLMQPPTVASLAPKTGAVQLEYNGKQYFLIFGAANTREGCLRPWCALERSPGGVTLEQWFTQFKADMDRPNGGAARWPEIDVEIRRAKVSGNDMSSIKGLYSSPSLLKQIRMHSLKPIVLDGRTGEGGGQLVRLAVALAALTLQPVQISHVRGNRPRGGGLKNQHVAAIEWLAKATEADVQGLHVGSKTVTFSPRRPATELLQRNISIRTESGAASATLVLQAMLPFLLFASNDASEPVVVELSGGTNVSFSPSYEYLDQVLVPTLEERFGVRIERELKGRGWSLGPLSRGSVWLRIHPIPKGERLKFVPPPRYSFPESFEVRSVDVSIITPTHSHEKLQETVAEDVGALWPGADVAFKVVEDSCSDGRWSVLLVAHSADGIRWARDVLTSAPKNIKGYDRFIALLSKKLCKGLYEEVSLAGRVDEHLQDQLVCFQALCDGPSSFPRGDDAAIEALGGPLGPLIDAMGQLNVGDDRMRREKKLEPFGHGSTHAKTARWVVSELLPGAEFYNRGDLVKGVGFSMQGASNTKMAQLRHFEFPENFQKAFTSQQFASANRDEHATTVGEALKRYPSAIFWAVAMSFTIVMVGYDTILMGSLMAYPSFVDRYGTYNPDLGAKVISGPWQVGLNTAGSCGGIFGMVINGVATERFGHRRVTMAALAIMTGLVFIPFFAPNAHILLAGQCLLGAVWGIFAVMGAVYSSEICPLALRGYMTSFISICWVVGQLIAAGILQGLVNNTTKWAYKTPFAVEWAWPVPLFVFAWLAPDSPWWLIRQGRTEDAARSLKRLSNGLTDEQIHQRVLMMSDTNRLEQALKADASYRDCLTGADLRRTEIACLLLSSQTLVGQVLSYNATYFFVQAGLSASDAYKMNFGNMGVAFVATCISWALMARSGRRTLLLCGYAFLTLNLLLIGVLSCASHNNSAAEWGQSALALVWLAAFSATVGPQTWAVASEVSATRLRAKTLSMAGVAYNIANIVDNTIEPYLINPTEADLKGKTAFVWFGISFLVTLWAAFRVPETRGRTYGELDVLFEKRTPAWRFGAAEVEKDAAVLETTCRR
ncbi:rna 3 -terminal phosphate cyclase [Trichoderma cornu-damae]|uniref:Rna 3 -terminal phosphate cyclase n=1 Tax=Trichoderma cornu-damae TaxID=654480 RepID=A0A9P8TUF8_9HYPO|nr:rna 3 -terminal phosphate cyclase [Trichoderma cornu-damae]